MVKAPTVDARIDLEMRLRAAGIQVTDAYTLVADQELYRTGKLPCRIEALDVAREISDLLVPIPCYPELSLSEIERIEAVLAFR
jgi:dTDP-4-amino-4,6-dideoxygalactose transaminase